jgi:peptidoglycan/LPS O-acetylase OafA/YrhL
LRNKRLDILRAIAVLLVLGHHGDGPTLWHNAGWVGVDLFFVLSGFLISGLLFSEFKTDGGINWRRFFIRRGFKIYPAFYTMIFVTFLWQVAKHQQIGWRSYLPEILFYQSYHWWGLWSHTWSLAVEEHFYILLPGLLLFLLWTQKQKVSLNPFRVLPVVWAILAVLCLVERSYLAYALSNVSSGYIRFSTHVRIDSLFFGVFLGYLHHFHPAALRTATAERWSRLLLLFCSALLVSTCISFRVDSRFMLSFGLTALYLGFGGILILVLYSDHGETVGLRWRLQKFGLGDLLAYIGMYSYSIYLWHAMVTLHFRTFLRLIWPTVGNNAIFWGYIMTSLIAGVLLSRLIEYPALNLRDRFFPSPQQRVRNDMRETAASSLQLAGIETLKGSTTCLKALPPEYR